MPGKSGTERHQTHISTHDIRKLGIDVVWSTIFSKQSGRKFAVLCNRWSIKQHQTKHKNQTIRIGTKEINGNLVSVPVTFTNCTISRTIFLFSTNEPLAHYYFLSFFLIYLFTPAGINNFIICFALKKKKRQDRKSLNTNCSILFICNDSLSTLYVCSFFFLSLFRFTRFEYCSVELLPHTDRPADTKTLKAPGLMALFSFVRLYSMRIRLQLNNMKILHHPRCDTSLVVSEKRSYFWETANMVEGGGGLYGKLYH